MIGIVQSSEIAKMTHSDAECRLLTVKFSDNDTRKVQWAPPPGDDSVPVKDSVAYCYDLGAVTVCTACYDMITPAVSTGERKIYASDGNGKILGYIYIKKTGELDLVSTDSSGNEKASVILLNTGKITVKNAAQSLSTLIDNFITILTTLKTFGSPTNHKILPSVVTQLNALKNNFDALLEA